MIGNRPIATFTSLLVIIRFPFMRQGFLTSWIERTNFASVLRLLADFGNPCCDARIRVRMGWHKGLGLLHGHSQLVRKPNR